MHLNLLHSIFTLHYPNATNQKLNYNAMFVFVNERGISTIVSLVPTINRSIAFLCEYSRQNFNLKLKILSSDYKIQIFLKNVNYCGNI